MDPDRPPGVRGWDRLFVECDSQGQILWMNDRARARLGSARNFLDAVPSAQVSEAWQLLRGGNAGDDPAMTCLLAPPMELPPFRFISCDYLPPSAK